MGSYILDQVFNSKLSKQGKTSLSGIFESQPSGPSPNNNLYQLQNGVTVLPGSVDVAKIKQQPAATYLEHLRQEKKI